MKKLVFMLLYLCYSFIMVFSQTTALEMKIVLNSSLDYGKKQLVIVDSIINSNFLDGINDKLKKAKKLSIFSVSKEYLEEGEYTIFISSAGQVLNEYTVKNHSVVYDVRRDCFLKCDVLFEVYELIARSSLGERLK